MRIHASQATNGASVNSLNRHSHKRSISTQVNTGWRKALGAAALALATWWAAPALAADTKVSVAVQSLTASGTTAAANWIKTINGVTYVKLVVASSAADPEMSELRARPCWPTAARCSCASTPCRRSR